MRSSSLRRLRLTRLTWCLAFWLVVLAVSPVTAPFATVDVGELAGLTAHPDEGGSMVMQDVLDNGARSAEIFDQLDFEIVHLPSATPSLTQRVARTVVLRL